MQYEFKQELEQMRHMIERGWCQGGVLAKNNLGHACSPHSDKTTEFSLRGALSYITPEVISPVTRHKMLDSLILNEIPFPSHSLESFNDSPSTTKEDVLAVLDRAIAANQPKGNT